MGIRVKHPVANLSETAFHKLDYQIMARAFDLYNSMGNLWDECDYKMKWLDQCTAEGLNAFAEVPITVTYKNFSKSYFIDLLIEGVIYELKTASDISAHHEAQTLNYLFCTNSQHGKIINFRPDSLQWRFVSTRLMSEQRKQFKLKTTNWNPIETTLSGLTDLLSKLLHDWGAYLDINLYKEAVLFFSGLPPHHANKRFCELSENAVIHFSGLSRNKQAYSMNLQKYLSASSYTEMNWINFDQNSVELNTIRKNYSATK